MDTQTILALVGIIATTIFGVWAIAVAFQVSRNVRITYALDQIIALTDDVAQSFQDLGITFRGEPVSANLVLLKGYLINTGRRDISREMIEDQISVHVPPEFEWVDCKVAGTSPSLHGEAIRKSAQEITFSTGLWKKKEYMKFEALAKVPVVDADPENLPKEKPTVRLRKAIFFTHRIADSDRIEETRIPKPSRLADHPLPLLAGTTKLGGIMAGVVLIVGFALIVAGQFGFMTSKQVGYTTNFDGIERVITVKVKGDRILLSGTDGFSQESTLSKFDELPDKRATVVTEIDNFPLIGGIIYCVLGALMLGLYGIRSMKERRMLALIASKE